MKLHSFLIPLVFALTWTPTLGTDLRLSPLDMISLTGQLPNSTSNPYKSLKITSEQIQSDLDSFSKGSASPEAIEKLYYECLFAPDGRKTQSSVDRDTKLGLLLEFYIQLHRLEDPNFVAFDPHYMVNAEPPVPPGSAIIPGQDPSTIQNPQLRAEYEELIRKNNERNALIYRDQTVAKYQDLCLRYAAFYIKAHYTIEDKDALKQIITTKLGTILEAQKLLTIQPSMNL